MDNYLIYDLEIVKAIPPKKGERIPGIEYVSKTGQDAWRCFDEMGIACCAAYDYQDDAYHVFLKDNMDEFQLLARERIVIGFNSQAFDDRLCAANGITVSSWDLLVAIWAGMGLEPVFRYPTHAGYGLNAMAKANGLPGKTGDGALAPVLWQCGRYGEVIDYCLRDVWITKRLMDKVLDNHELISPKQQNVWIPISPRGQY